MFRRCPLNISRCRTETGGVAQDTIRADNLAPFRLGEITVGLDEAVSLDCDFGPRVRYKSRLALSLGAPGPYRS